jgi:hypothetical protein
MKQPKRRYVVVSGTDVLGPISDLKVLEDFTRVMGGTIYRLVEVRGKEAKRGNK